MCKEHFELDLPLYLQESLDQIKRTISLPYSLHNYGTWTADWCDLSASINMAWVSQLSPQSRPTICGSATWEGIPMVDFTGSATTLKTYGGANGKKLCIRYLGAQWMLKFPTVAKLNANLDYANTGSLSRMDLSTM